MTGRRSMTVSPLWLQGSILTFIIGFSLLTFSAIRIYQDHAPVPERIVDEAGNVLFTRQKILDGQELFLTYGLMQFGTVYGHGAYLGPDFTADYLHRMAVHMNKRYGDDEAAQGRTRRELQANRYDPKTGTLVWTEGQVSAFEEIHAHFRELMYGRKVSGEGLKAGMITDAEDARAITSLHRLDGVDGRRPAAGKDVLLHEQLASRGAGRKRPHRRRHHVECPVAGDAPGRERPGPGPVWPPFPGRRLARDRGAASTVRAACLGGPDARPARDRLVLPGRRGAVPAPEPRRRGDRALHGRDRRFFRHRPAEVAALQSDPDLAPPDGHLLRGDGVPRRRHLPGTPHLRTRAARPGGALCLTSRRAGRGRLRQPGRRVPELPQPPAPGAAFVLRGSGVGVPGARPVLDVPAHRRDGALAGHHLPGTRGPGWPSRAGETCRGCSSTARYRSRPSTRSAC